MSKEFKCAGCGTWYDESEDECPFCENENVSDTRGYPDGRTERTAEGTQGDSL